jgi:iron-sulfur cluster repair protein YtfE (RIC family)
MSTTSSTSRSTPKNVPQQGKDAIALLIEDHETVKSMFEQYEGLGDRAFVTKKKLATEICTELTKHATAEEEIFYPAARAAGNKDQDDLIDEGLVEHASAKDLIAQIMEMASDEDLFDAKVKVLSELIEHHVKEEEGEMFPKARKDGLDLVELGRRIAARKAELT